MNVLAAAAILFYVLHAGNSRTGPDELEWTDSLEELDAMIDD